MHCPSKLVCHIFCGVTLFHGSLHRVTLAARVSFTSLYPPFLRFKISSVGKKINFTFTLLSSGVKTMGFLPHDVWKKAVAAIMNYSTRRSSSNTRPAKHCFEISGEKLFITLTDCEHIVIALRIHFGQKIDIRFFLMQFRCHGHLLSSDLPVLSYWRIRKFSCRSNSACRPLQPNLSGDGLSGDSLFPDPLCSRFQLSSVLVGYKNGHVLCISSKGKKGGQLFQKQCTESDGGECDEAFCGTSGLKSYLFLRKKTSSLFRSRWDLRSMASVRVQSKRRPSNCFLLLIFLRSRCTLRNLNQRKQDDYAIEESRNDWPLEGGWPDSPKC